MCVVSPFQGLRLAALLTQGGATRRTPRRSALGCCVAAPSGRKFSPKWSPSGTGHVLAPEETAWRQHVGGFAPSVHGVARRVAGPSRSPACGGRRDGGQEYRRIRFAPLGAENCPSRGGDGGTPRDRPSRPISLPAVPNLRSVCNRRREFLGGQCTQEPQVPERG